MDRPHHRPLPPCWIHRWLLRWLLRWLKRQYFPDAARCYSPYADFYADFCRLVIVARSMQISRFRSFWWFHLEAAASRDNRHGFCRIGTARPHRRGISLRNFPDGGVWCPSPEGSSSRAAPSPPTPTSSPVCAPARRAVFLKYSSKEIPFSQYFFILFFIKFFSIYQ